MDNQQPLRRQLAGLYPFWCILTMGLGSYLLPYIMDYYCLQTTRNPITFYRYHIVGNVSALLISSLILFLLCAFFYGIFSRIDLAMVPPFLFAGILSYASHIKLLVRDDMVNYQDLTIKEAAGIAGDYISFDNSIYFYIMVGFICLWILAGFGFELLSKPCKADYSQKKKTIIRIVTSLLSALLLISVVPKLVQNSENLTKQTKAVLSSGQDTCVLYCFVESDSYNFDSTDAASALAELLQAARDFMDGSSVTDSDGDLETDKNSGNAEPTESGLQPNVIVIMNESWWNISPLLQSDITCSQDPMATWNTLQNSCVSGEVAVNIFGGGTISSETEFLTGANMKYFSSNVGISNYLEKRSYNPSIVTYFNSLDYETIAIHPYTGTFYNRSTIYDSYGFDKTVFEEDMTYTGRYDAYISDESLANQIIAEYEEEQSTDSDSPVFIWSVSIAAHETGLDENTQRNEDYAYPISIDYSRTDLTASEEINITRTINSFYLACEAYQTLVDYFSDCDTPTVILMYGDHCPPISVAIDDLTGQNEFEGNEDSNYALYTTPVLMWKNYECDTEPEETITDFSGENIQYLVPALIDYAGLADCDMADIIRYLNSCIKTNSLMFMKNPDGSDLTAFTSEQKDAYINFGILQNDLLMGDGDYSELWIAK